MDLQAYLDRIGFVGSLRPDAESLRRIHHRHLLSIAYENLSVQRGEPCPLDAAHAYRKIVEDGRGGWCYEMNGLLAWALEEIGFEVMRMTAGVRRAQLGDRVLGNHLALAVHLDDGPWLADVGFGDGLREPIPLRPATVEQGGLRYRLARLDDGYWRLYNQPHGGAPSFDFRYEPADEALFLEMSTWLSTDPESSFVQNLVVQRFTEGSIEILRGRVRRTVTPSDVHDRMLETPEELEEELSDAFGLALDAAPLWPAIVRRHAEVFGTD